MVLPIGIEDPVRIEGITVVFSYGINQKGFYEIAASVVKDNPGAVGLESRIIDDPEILMDSSALRTEIDRFKSDYRAAITASPNSYK